MTSENTSVKIQCYLAAHGLVTIVYDGRGYKYAAPSWKTFNTEGRNDLEPFETFDGEREISRLHGLLILGALYEE